MKKIVNRVKILASFQKQLGHVTVGMKDTGMTKTRLSASRSTGVSSGIMIIAGKAKEDHFQKFIVKLAMPTYHINIINRRMSWKHQQI